eukprot:8684299-Pyramimonas_sp.AAC.1
MSAKQDFLGAQRCWFAQPQHGRAEAERTHARTTQTDRCQSTTGEQGGARRSPVDPDSLPLPWEILRIVL